MIKVIKHGNAIHAYKCSKCGCIFTANKRDIEIENINGLLYCPECGNYIRAVDYITYNSPLQYRIFNKILIK